MAVNGAKFHLNSKPPHSKDLSEVWKPWIYETINMFGFERCMYESNFPVDKVSFSYDVLYNAFKKYSKNFSKSERSSMFHDNAIKFYKVEEA